MGKACARFSRWSTGIFAVVHTPIPPWSNGINDLLVDRGAKRRKTNELTVKIFKTLGLRSAGADGAPFVAAGEGNSDVTGRQGLLNSIIAMSKSVQR